MPAISAICTRVETAYTLVCREIGISLIPHLYVEKCDQPTEHTDFFQVSSLMPVYSLSILHTKDLQLAPVHKRLIDIAQELYG